MKGISKNLAFDHLILNPSPKGEGQKEFLEMPLNYTLGLFYKKQLCWIIKLP